MIVPCVSLPVVACPCLSLFVVGGGGGGGGGGLQFLL